MLCEKEEIKVGKTCQNRIKKEGKRSISDEDIKMDNSRVVKNRERRKQLTSPSPTCWTERKMERERKNGWYRKYYQQENIERKKWAGLEMLRDKKKKNRFEVIRYNHLQPRQYNYHICWNVRFFFKKKPKNVITLHLLWGTEVSYRLISSSLFITIMFHVVSSLNSLHPNAAS